MALVTMELESNMIEKDDSVFFGLVWMYVFARLAVNDDGKLVTL